MCRWRWARRRCCRPCAPRARRRSWWPRGRAAVTRSATAPRASRASRGGPRGRPRAMNAATAGATLPDALRSTLGFEPLGAPVANLTLGKGVLDGRPVRVALVENRIASGSIGKAEVAKLVPLSRSPRARSPPWCSTWIRQARAYPRGWRRSARSGGCFARRWQRASRARPSRRSWEGTATAARACSRTWPRGGSSAPGPTSRCRARRFSRRRLARTRWTTCSGPSRRPPSAPGRAPRPAMPTPCGRRAWTSRGGSGRRSRRERDRSTPSTSATSRCSRGWKWGSRPASRRPCGARNSRSSPGGLPGHGVRRRHYGGSDASGRGGPDTGARRHFPRGRRAGVAFRAGGLAARDPGARAAGGPPRLRVARGAAGRRKIVLTEFVVDMGVALAALAARGHPCRAHHSRPAGGGVYVALAAPATRVSVVYGADIQVLPARSWRAYWEPTATRWEIWPNTAGPGWPMRN